MTSVYCAHCGANRTTADAACPFCGTVFAGAQAPIGVVSGAPAGVLEALRDGNKIEAIVRYRVATKCSLKEGKDAVDALEKRLRL